MYNTSLMELNLNKGKHMRFVRFYPIFVDYCLGSYKVELVENICDSGVLLDTKLSFIMHINITENEVRRTLGFIKFN